MQDRIEEIYRQKAALGLGYDGGCMDRYINPMMGMGEGEDDYDDDDDMYGGARRRKLSAYNKFVQAFLKKPVNKRKYRTQKALFKAAAAAWRASGRSASSGRKRKRCPKGSRKSTRKGARGKCVRRRRGAGMEFDGNVGMGVLVGGAKRLKPYKPTKKQLENLGLDADQFAKFASQKVKVEKEIPRFSRTQLSRIGNRYAYTNSKGICNSEDPSGPYWLNDEYKCTGYDKKTKAADTIANLTARIAELEKKN